MSWPSDRSPLRNLDPGTGGVRDSYKPDLGSIASHSQYSDDIQKEARAPKKGLVTRILIAIRRSVWG